MKLVIGIFLVLLMAMLLSGCTVLHTVLQPARVRTPQIVGADSLIIRPVVTNTATRTIEKARIEFIHDTVKIIEKEIVVQSVPFLDTSALAGYMDTAFKGLYHTLERQRVELKTLMSGIISTRSQQVELIKKLDTTKTERNIARKEVATTKTIMYDGTTFLFLLVILVLILFFIRQQYLKYQLKKKLGKYETLKN